MLFGENSQAERRTRRVSLLNTRREETYPPRPHRGLFLDRPQVERREEMYPPADRAEGKPSYGTFREPVGWLV
jgi:hypothetical protein